MLRGFRPAFPALRVVVLVLGGLALGTSSVAQAPVPLGGQFQVNVTTTSDQSFSAASTDGTGWTLVVWESFVSAGGDASARSIQGRWFDPTGAAGVEFQVNTTTLGEQKSPAVATDAQGRSVVVWESDEDPTAATSFDIRARVFDVTGAPLGADFVVNTVVSQDQLYPAVAFSGDHGFLVVWQSDVDLAANTDFDIRAREFNLSGLPQGGELPVNTLTTSAQESPAVAADVSGNWLVVWQSDGSVGNDTTTTSIQGRWLGATAPSSGQFQVNAHPPVASDRAPTVAVARDGGAVVVWESGGSSGSDNSLASIQARRYAVDGAPAPVVQVNTYIPDDQRFPAVGMHPAGRFLVSWQSFGSPGGDTSLYAVVARAFGADGTPFGDDLQVNVLTPGDQRFPAVAVGPSGSALVAWESDGSVGDDAFGFSIQARRFDLALLFSDGFETGSRSRWSSGTP